MLNQIVVGTLSTLNTLMSPFAGAGHAAKSTYLLEPAQSTGRARMRCESNHRAHAQLNVHSDSDTSVSVLLTGSICSDDGNVRPVALAFVLPIDLIDDQFLRALPENVPYVLTGVKGDDVSNDRIKLTRQPTIKGLTPIVVEWIPSIATVQPERRRRLKIWIESRAWHSEDLLWRKIEVAELEASSVSSRFTIINKIMR